MDPNTTGTPGSAFAQLITNLANNASSVVIDGATAGTNPMPFAGLMGYGSDNSTGPKAYLNVLVFDQNYQLLTSSFVPVTTAARETGSNVPHQYLKSPQITIQQPGYVYIYFSNENPTSVEVFFDDFKVTHTNSNIVQKDDYYPFGMTFNSYSAPSGVGQMYLYQGKEFLDDHSLNVYDFHARGYDPAIGRTWQLDPHTENYFSWSPYSWVANNPVLHIDPDGKDWFVSTQNGVLINIKGQNEFSFSNLKKEYGQEIANFIYELSGGASNDSWENFGADDMFDSKDNKISKNLGGLTMMTEGVSEQFMMDNGYYKALVQSVSELDFRMFELELNGRRVDSGGRKEILNSKITYKRSNEFGVFQRELDIYNFPMLSMQRSTYTHVIDPNYRKNHGSTIRNKSNPDFESLGLNFYQDFVVPWMLKSYKK
nr:RHS repeat-associated core domain-containing protein [Belliella kenyensis]